MTKNILFSTICPQGDVMHYIVKYLLSKKYVNSIIILLLFCSGCARTPYAN